MAVEKNIMWKKGKQYHLPYHIQAVGKNIKWGRGVRKSRSKKMGVGKKIKL